MAKVFCASTNCRPPTSRFARISSFFPLINHNLLHRDPPRDPNISFRQILGLGILTLRTNYFHTNFGNGGFSINHLPSRSRQHGARRKAEQISSNLLETETRYNSFPAPSCEWLMLRGIRVILSSNNPSSKYNFSSIHEILDKSSVFFVQIDYFFTRNTILVFNQYFKIYRVRDLCQRKIVDR